MSVTELTSQLDRSELKEEAWLNTAREEWVRAKEQALGKPKGGGAEGRTRLHGGDGADVPARQVGIEGGGGVEHCARVSASTKDSVLASKGREATAPPFMLVTLLTSHRERSLLKPAEHS